VGIFDVAALGDSLANATTGAIKLRWRDAFARLLQISLIGR